MRRHLAGAIVLVFAIPSSVAADEPSVYLDGYAEVGTFGDAKAKAQDNDYAATRDRPVGPGLGLGTRLLVYLGQWESVHFSLGPSALGEVWWTQRRTQYATAGLGVLRLQFLVPRGEGNAYTLYFDLFAGIAGVWAGPSLVSTAAPGRGPMVGGSLGLMLYLPGYKGIFVELGGKHSTTTHSVAESKWKLERTHGFLRAGVELGL